MQVCSEVGVARLVGQVGKVKVEEVDAVCASTVGVVVVLGSVHAAREIIDGVPKAQVVCPGDHGVQGSLDNREKVT